VVRRIAARADAVVENFRPGVADRLGIGYVALSAENPRLVYAAISGYGPDGPYADQPAYDTVIQGLTGFMHFQGTPDEPALVRGIAADKAIGLSAASAVIAALFARERTGAGSASTYRCSMPMQRSRCRTYSARNRSVRSRSSRPGCSPRPTSTAPGRPRTATS
jgi:crotonobetainyl-CoA:carnitine CoA-transferase CaiB-like acyl-CoA transferase